MRAYTLLLLLLAAVTSLTAQIAEAANPSPAETLCVGLLNDRAAALTVSDWSALREISTTFLRECKSVEDRNTLTGARTDIAISYVEQGQFRDALKSADECIKQHYSHPSCHLVRGQALAGLKQNVEAKQAFHRAEQLADQQIEALNTILARPNLAWGVRESRESDLGLFTSVRDAARRLQQAL